MTFKRYQTKRIKSIANFLSSSRIHNEKKIIFPICDARIFGVSQVNVKFRNENSNNRNVDRPNERKVDPTKQ